MFCLFTCFKNTQKNQNNSHMPLAFCTPWTMGNGKTPLFLNRKNKELRPVLLYAPTDESGCVAVLCMNSETMNRTPLALAASMKLFVKWKLKKNGGINRGLVLRSPDAWMKLERKRELAANIVPFLATLWKLE